MWTLTSIALAGAAPSVGQVAESCGPACTVAVEVWMATRDGRYLIPPRARRRDPARFEALGLGRLIVVADGSDPPPGLAWLETDRWGTALASPDDPGYFLQWGLNNDGGSPSSLAGADVGAEATWDFETGGVIIAILDSGISLSQPDLRLWINAGEVAANGIDDDNNGYVDDARGWDFAASDPDPSDVGGHGTHVASIAAATGNNGDGLAGVCWGCEVMAARNLNDAGSGLYSWWAESIVYAVDNGADVLNMSEGGYGTDRGIELAVAYAVGAGVPVVVAAGNDASDQWPNFPALLPEVFAVGATRTDDERAASFDWGGGSSYGPHLDLVAPGTFIYGLPMGANNGPTYWSGTSQATPFVAGAAALLLSMEPSLTVDEVRGYLETGAADGVGAPAEDLPGWDPYMGHGRLDIATSVGLLAADIADADADGVDLRSGDCDDTDATVAPNAAEACNGRDDDCDGRVPADEIDADGDGWLACDDCDDAAASRFPGAPEVPGDGIDQDCDGVDEAESVVSSPPIYQAQSSRAAPAAATSCGCRAAPSASWGLSRVLWRRPSPHR